MSKSVSTNVFKKKSGIQSIQAYLESGRSITALEALSNFGIFRLASAIEVLRNRGMDIETEMKKDPNGKTYARYVLGEAEVPKKELKVGARVRSRGLCCGQEGTVSEVREYAAPGACAAEVCFDGASAPVPMYAYELEVI